MSHILVCCIVVDIYLSLAHLVAVRTIAANVVKRTTDYGICVRAGSAGGKRGAEPIMLISMFFLTPS